MKKLQFAITTLFLGLLAFLLPFASANVFAAPGDRISATITIGGGLSYTVPDTIQFDDLATISSGGTTEYVSTGGTHVINFAMDILYENQGYTFTSATVNGVNTPIVEPTHTGEDHNYKITVSEETSYTINLTATKTGQEKYTIIWANPDVVDDIQDEDMLIENGFANIIAVYDAGGHLVDPVEYLINPEGALIDGYGHVRIAPGYRVVFEFTPIYGYQLTSVSANGIALEPQEATNQYTFTMPSTNIHFAAVFTRTNDAVVNSSEKVKGGAITLGEGTLDAGTAQLSVNDIELDAAKIKDFDKASNGMAIANILDIDFFNIFYKGKSDSEDVWSNQIHELDEEATITLKLADDIDVSKVVIVHNIDDGDEYEIIKIDSYDLEAHTITFKTKSFSNFAIAIGAGAPNTGVMTNDSGFAKSNIYVAILGAIIASAVAVVIYRRYATHKA